MKNIEGKKISIIMPAYNEEARIVDSLKETIKTFDDFKSNYEIIVVDDGSNDQTYEQTKKFSQDIGNGKIVVRRNRANYGKGRTLYKGFRYATGDYIIFLDADMDLHPGQIDTFFDIMELTDSDIVIGSKRHPNSKLFYPWERRIMSAVYFFIIKLLFGLPLNDTQTGLKLFKKQVLKEVFREFMSREFAFDLELLVTAHSLGYKIAEAPVFINSQRGYSRIGVVAVYKMCVDTVAIYLRYLRNRSRRFAYKLNKKGFLNFTMIFQRD
ncbi:MAG: glycosyltransferase [Candidatus Omnitrophota bacterium]